MSATSKDKRLFYDYDGFVEKFKPKKTTDDCYTPDNIYECVADYVAGYYNLDKSGFVRPFWPGGDYKSFSYPPGSVVVDNPPFSILASIMKFYQAHGIRFFLFAPALTALDTCNSSGTCIIAVGNTIRFENGAEICISFATNLEELALRTAPDLYRELERVNKINKRQGKKEMPKYIYPDYVMTAATANKYCKYGIDYGLERKSASFIKRMDSQKEAGKGIFGAGYLLSERAAAERAAAERAVAERAAPIKWQISDREWEIIRGLE